MEQSILKSTKQVLHIGADDESFDLNILTFINSAFSTLADLGVGPDGGYAISDETATWNDFLPDDPIQQGRVKTFVLLSARLAFDPPQQVFVLNALQDQLQEATWRLSVQREGISWQDPDPEPDPDESELGDYDGGTV